MGKAIKSVAKIALPVAASFVPGIGPLGAAAIGAAGGALSGGGLKGAALGAIGGGLGNTLFAGAPGTTGFGLFDSAQSSLYNAASPLRSIGSSIFGGSSGSNSPLSSIFGGGSKPQESLPWLEKAATSTQENLPWLKDVMSGKLLPNKYVDGYTNIANATNNKGILERLGNIISNPSIEDAFAAANLFQMLQDPTPEGMLTQRDILNQMNADKAKQQADADRFIASLNSSPLQRVQTNPNVDYYSYGHRPEVKFFDSVEGQPMKFARGGKVPAIDSMKGQADTVHAKLSEGEYVIPADVVASLGDGNSMAGAKALDHMLKNVRKTKAPAMKKGVLPPKSKSPLAYIGKAA